MAIPLRTVFASTQHAPKAFVLLLLILSSGLVDDRAGPAGQAASAISPIAFLNVSDSSDKIPVFDLRVALEHDSGCGTDALCLDTATGEIGTARNAVFYAALGKRTTGSASSLMALEPNSLLELSDRRGRSYEYRAIRSTRFAAGNPALAGYTSATPGRVITLVQCDVALNDGLVPTCVSEGAEVSVLRAEAVEQAQPVKATQLGSPSNASWTDFSVALPGLLVGHLVFLAGLAFFAFLSFRGYRQGSARSSPGPLDVVALLLGCWLLLGLALTEFGTNYAVNDTPTISRGDWLIGGAAFTIGLLLSSYLLWRLGLQSGRYIQRLAAVITALGLIGVYYWESKTGSDGHSLFFTQLAASLIGLLLCPVLAFIVVNKKLGSAVARPRFRALASLMLNGLVLGTALAWLADGEPQVQLPGIGSLILSPAIELLTVVCLISLLAPMVSGSERNDSRRQPSPLTWSGPASGIGVLFVTDTGVAFVLVIACLLTLLVAGVPIKRIGRAGGLLALLALLILLAFPGAVPARAHGRIEAWLDPSGYTQRTERVNQAVRAFQRIVDHRLDQHIQPVHTRDPQAAAPTITSQIEDDIDKVELELNYRLHDLIMGDIEVAEGLVPEPGSGDVELLLIGEELWFGLGGSEAAERPRDVASLKRQVQEAVIELRDMASQLSSLENSSAVQVLGRSQDELRASYRTSALLHADNYQQRQSISALHAGRLIGTGWGLGSPQRLPLATEDMTVALLGEALGFLGLASVVILTAQVVQVGIGKIDPEPDSRLVLATSGLSILLGVHAFVAIGGALNLLPLSGIPLPFAGRSGTSLMMAWIAVALLIGLRAQVNDPSVYSGRVRVHTAPLRIALPGSVVGVLAGIFIVALTGYAFSPTTVLADVRQTMHLPLENLSDQGGAILDRNGHVLARLGVGAGGGRYPDKELAGSLSHTLTSLTARFSDDLVAPRVNPALSLLGGRFWRGRSPPSLTTTIDLDIQRTLHRTFDARLQSVDLDPESAGGAAILLDATTGEILASESRPIFDPGIWTDRSSWAENELESRRAGIDGRLLNRAINGGYAPGSTFKVITLAAALESGLFTPGSEVFHYRTADPALKYHRLEFEDGPPVVDANHPHPGDWSFGVADALVWSDNVAFAQMALTLGPEAIIEMARRFGFEQKISVEGLGSSVSSIDSSQGKTPDRYVRVSEAGLAHTGYGQGELSVTPLQMAMVAAVVANDGVLMEPFVVDGWKGVDERIVRRPPQPLLKDVVRPEVVREMQAILWSSVSDGWARDARVNYANEQPGVAGKTGTAEWSSDGRSPHSWFIGYYPAEHPRVAVAVLVEEAGGSHLASLIGRDVFASPAVNSYATSAFEKAGPSEEIAKVIHAMGSLGIKDDIPPPLSLEILDSGDRPSALLDPARVRTMIATGDVIPARKVDATIRSRDNDFLYPVPRTAAVTSSADLTLVNLEAPLLDGCPAHDSGLTFCGQKGFVRALTAAGVDIASLENNHIDDYGPLGVLETKEALSAAGIAVADRNVPVVRDVRGLRFGFLAFNGVGDRFDRQYIKTQIHTLRPQVDVLVVSFQWGAEYVPLPQPAPGIADDDPVGIAHLAVDAGADLIIGNHPHHVQAVEVYEGKLITYAHGNFIFDQMWSYESRLGVIARYTFYDESLVGVDFLPTLIEDYAQPRLLEGAEAQAVLSSIREASDALATQIDGHR